MLRAVKLCHWSSISGPSATAKPRSAKISASSSITWLTGWTDPCGISGAGSDRSTRSVASLCSSSAASSSSLRSAIASVTASRSAWIFGAFGRPRVRVHRPQRLEHGGHASRLAERRDAQLFERGEVGAPAAIGPVKACRIIHRRGGLSLGGMRYCKGSRRQERVGRNRLLQPVDRQHPPGRRSRAIAAVEPRADCAGRPDRGHRRIGEVIDLGALQFVGMPDVAAEADRHQPARNLGLDRPLDRPRDGEDNGGRRASRSAG